MPVYEYQCEQCGQIFEVMQKFSDAPLADCQACGGPVQKLISQAAFALKGGGWYAQGYGGGKKQPAACEAKKSDPSGACASCPKAANE